MKLPFAKKTLRGWIVGMMEGNRRPFPLPARSLSLLHYHHHHHHWTIYQEVVFEWLFSFFKQSLFHKDMTAFQWLGYNPRRHFSCDTQDFLYGMAWETQSWSELCTNERTCSFSSVVAKLKLHVLPLVHPTIGFGNPWYSERLRELSLTENQSFSFIGIIIIIMIIIITVTIIIIIIVVLMITIKVSLSGSLSGFPSIEGLVQEHTLLSHLGKMMKTFAFFREITRKKWNRYSNYFVKLVELG